MDQSPIRAPEVNRSMPPRQLEPTPRPPGFFALGRICTARWRSKKSPVPERQTIAATDASERNVVEALVLGWLTFAFWIFTIEALLPELHWSVSIPVSMVAAFILLQCVTFAIALLMEKILASNAGASAQTIRAWHTRGHIAIMIILSIGIITAQSGDTLLRGLAWCWIALSFANTFALIFESGGIRRSIPSPH